MKMDRKFYTLPEVCKIYGLSIDTLRYWARNGKIQAVKVGRRFHVDIDTIEALFGQKKPNI